MIMQTPDRVPGNIPPPSAVLRTGPAAAADPVSLFVKFFSREAVFFLNFAMKIMLDKGACAYYNKNYIPVTFCEQFCFE